jgi:hypothetical protein
VHVNTSVVKDIVDAIGGIDVVIESDDPRGIYEPIFDGICYKPTPEFKQACIDGKNQLLKLPNGPAHLDGLHALLLAQARNSSGGYGMSNSNFDREKNQQKVIIGIKEKAVKNGLSTNFEQVTKIMESLGNNLRTNFKASEVRTLADLLGDIDNNNIKQIPLSDTENNVYLVQTSIVGDASVVVPVAGIFDYTGIIKHIKQQISAEGWEKEGAEIEVWNGSGVVGYGSTKANELEKDGFTIGEIKNAPAGGTYSKVTIYKLSNDNPETEKKLIQQYNLSTIMQIPTELAYSAETTADFVIIFGQ